MSCNNPDCLCQGVEPNDTRKLAARDLEAKYRLAASRLLDAEKIVGELSAGGYGADNLPDALIYLKDALSIVTASYAMASEKYGFAIRTGIGPNDWRDK